MQFQAQALHKLPDGIVHVGDEGIPGILHGLQNYTAAHQTT